MPHARPRSTRTVAIPLVLCALLAACGSDGGGSYDQRVEIEVHDDVLGTHVAVSGRRALADPAPARDWYDAVLTGNAAWSTHERPNGCDALDSDPTGRTLRCTNPFDNTYSGSNEDGEDAVFFHPLYIDTPADAEIGVEIAYAESARERNPGSARAAASFLHLENPPPRFEIDAPTAVLAHADEVTAVTFAMAQPADAFPRDAHLRVSVPEHAVVTAAEVSSTEPWVDPDPSTVPCELGEDVSCPLPDFDPRRTYEATLHLMSTRAGDAPLGAAIVLDEPEPDVAPVRRDVHVAHVASTAPLQALLDAAEEGDLVTLPPGVYGGTLRGNGRRFDVRGAEGEEPTVLVGGATVPVLQGIAPRTTWSNLVLRSYGAPVAALYGANVTLADSVIEPAPGAPHRLAAGIMNPHHVASFRLLGNTIRGWGASEGSECERLIDLTQHGATIYLQHNLFVDNRCDAVLGSELLAPIPVFGEYDDIDLRASNNTFVDAPVLIGLTGHADAPRRLVLRNNIMVGTDTVLALGDELRDFSEERFVPTLTTSANLSWGGAGPASIDASSAARVNLIVESADLHVDPAFADAGAGDYRLTALSPAVDAGVPPGDYRWYPAYAPCGRLSCEGALEPQFGPEDYPQPGPDAVRPPVDGDLDGVVEHDIGAFEFRP